MTARYVFIHSQQPFDVNCGRPSIWSNPWTHEPLEMTIAMYRVDTVEEAVAKYKAWVVTQPILMRKLRNLRGKALGCFCPDDGRPCHVRDVLIPLVEALPA